MEDDKKRILSFLCWYTKDELTDHMQFALGFYTVFCICMFPFPFETFGARSPILYIILGIELFLWIAYAVWYKIIKNSEENKISAAYLHAGTVFGTTSLVLFSSAALSFQSSGIPFGKAHILANAAGIFLNLFVLTVRIIQYNMLMLGGYLILCFSIVFFINLCAARKNWIDEYYASVSPINKKR